MTTDTLTHDVTVRRFGIIKTANDTKLMTIENGPQGPQGPQGATKALYIPCFSFTPVIESRVAARAARQTVKPCLVY